MHLLGYLLNEDDDLRAQQHALSEGLNPEALSTFKLKATTQPALLLSFTNVDIKSAPRIADKLANALMK